MGAGLRHQNDAPLWRGIDVLVKLECSRQENVPSCGPRLLARSMASHSARRPKMLADTECTLPSTASSCRSQLPVNNNQLENHLLMLIPAFYLFLLNVGGKFVYGANLNPQCIRLLRLDENQF